ncbi:MAG: hypothetical protein NTW49_11785 [Bacteroidia bacterium]|nr:hypothetical protein [Bacteroidia bacterium]
MFTGEKIIYVHLQKTGGLHITSLLSKVIKGDVGEYHQRLPESFIRGDKLIVGSIRNPWNWYVSLWSFGCENNGKLQFALQNRNYHLYRKMKNLPLRWMLFMLNETVKPVSKYRNVYKDINDPGLFREWLRLLLDSSRRFDMGELYGISPVSKFAGLLTYRYVRLYFRDNKMLFRDKHISNLMILNDYDREQNVIDFTIRNENLNNDLLTALNMAGYRLTGEQSAVILAPGRTNPSGHKDYRIYYDKECTEMVTEKEKFIIDKYGYSTGW